MRDKPVIIIGNGGHSRVLIDTLLLHERRIIGYTAPVEEENPYNLAYIGNDQVILRFSPEEVELVNAIGSISDTSLREKLFTEFKSQGYFFSSVIHPSAIIASTVKLGEGIQILAGVVIQPFVKVDDNTIVNTSATIDHDCYIGKHCHIAPGCILSGSVNIDEGTHIGTGSTIIQNIRIGKKVLIGAGSLVIKDVLDNKVVYGTPAKEVMK
ncbi:acetyltransferase [Robertmurraya andreesenii]|uniref:UDP-perosamine 4-acetyltransferase n=1 Tax=Anoxybacillus andreesenii TaxID=1325932 RepID=A0ABT9V7H9_9BACL|nr:acetyltransferase [Robertmurraya andreesenii]MDQ0156908.1 UDP-perosamine 4-acetyltransferase [Robertmurraya andreesenii]